MKQRSQDSEDSEVIECSKIYKDVSQPEKTDPTIEGGEKER